MLKQGKRLAILFRGTRRVRKSDLGFALQNCERSAQFMRSVSYETALPFEGDVEAVEKTVQSRREAAQFVGGILHGKAIVKRGFTDAVGASRHICDWGKISSRKEIASGRRQNDRDRNQPAKRQAKVCEQFALWMTRCQDYESARSLRCREVADIAARSPPPATKCHERLAASR